MSSMNNVVMQMLAGGIAPAGLSVANLQERLGELARNDARIAPLVQHLQERLAAKNNAVETAADEELVGEVEQPTAPIIEPRSPSGRTREYKSLARRMFTELQRVRDRNSMLADALGACGQCWGEDAACEYCSGNGCVGAYLINPKLFESVVGPALEQLRQRPPLLQQKNNTSKGEGNHALR